MAGQEARTGSGKTVYLCGVVGESCVGSLAQLSNSLKGKGIRCHASPAEAFKCHRRYLLSQGWEQISPREFRPPGGGPIRVLTKQSRFGAKMRPGKESRSMPSIRTGGVVVSV